MQNCVAATDSQGAKGTELGYIQAQKRQVSGIKTRSYDEVLGCDKTSQVSVSWTLLRLIQDSIPYCRHSDTAQS
jgi:hypothetical protein